MSHGRRGAVEQHLQAKLKGEESRGVVQERLAFKDVDDAAGA